MLSVPPYLEPLPPYPIPRPPPPAGQDPPFVGGSQAAAPAGTESLDFDRYEKEQF